MCLRTGKNDRQCECQDNSASFHIFLGEHATRVCSTAGPNPINSNAQIRPLDPWKNFVVAMKHSNREQSSVIGPWLNATGVKTQINRWTRDIPVTSELHWARRLQPRAPSPR